MNFLAILRAALMSVNWWAVLVCAILSMVIGFIWYGPLFGKKWTHLNGGHDMDPVKMKEMQKKMGSLYLTQFLLSVFQLFVLAHLTGYTGMSGMISAFFVWAGFVLPTVAASCMWSGESRQDAWSRFRIQAGYQLVSFLIFGFILGAWY